MLEKTIEAISRENKATDDVDDVVLVSEQWRETDEKEPKHDGEKENAVKFSRVKIDQEQQERGVQRREKIKGRIHSAKPIEDRAEPSARVRTRKSEAQRQKQKAKTGKENRGYESPRKSLQLLVRSEKECSCGVKEVDCHVRENHERSELVGAGP